MTGDQLFSNSKLHKQVVNTLVFNEKYDCMVSTDSGGMIEYWRPDESFQKPDTEDLWKFKSSTDLYQIKKARSTAVSSTLSPDNSKIAFFTIPDRQIRIFTFLTGKLWREYDENLNLATEMQQVKQRCLIYIIFIK